MLETTIIISEFYPKLLKYPFWVFFLLFIIYSSKLNFCDSIFYFFLFWLNSSLENFCFRTLNLTIVWGFGKLFNINFWYLLPDPASLLQSSSFHQLETFKQLNCRTLVCHFNCNQINGELDEIKYILDYLGIPDIGPRLWYGSLIEKYTVKKNNKKQNDRQREEDTN